MRKGNFDADNMTVDPDKLMSEFEASEDDLVCGTVEAPGMFYDKLGRLHIVLYGRQNSDRAKLLRDPKDGQHPNNADKGYGSSDLGVFIHEYNSPPIDQVCPCKLDPNKSCPGSN